MRSSDLPNELVDRGIHWQIAGFLLVACASVAILTEFADTDHREFVYFEIAATKLYWALVIPLAGLFDGARKMFEKMSEIRAKRRQRWLDEGRREGRRQERERVRAECSVSAPPFRRRLWPLCSMNRTITASQGTRKMFEEMSEIRAKRRQTWLDGGRSQEREELRGLGVTLPRESIDYLDGKDDKSERQHGC